MAAPSERLNRQRFWVAGTRPAMTINKGVRKVATRLKSHGRQFACGLGDLKDAPQARRPAAALRAVLDIAKAAGSHHP